MARGCGLAACASHPPPSVASLPGKESCFFTRTVFTWTVLDDSTLIVDAPMNDPYLVKLLSPIPQLRFHERIGFDNGPSARPVLPTTGYIVARGQFAQRTPTIAVRALSPQQAKQLIAAAKSPQPHKQGAGNPPPPPAD